MDRAVKSIKIQLLKLDRLFTKLSDKDKKLVNRIIIFYRFVEACKPKYFTHTKK